MFCTFLAFVVFGNLVAFLFIAKPGVNFTNVLRAAYTQADPKSAIKLINLTVFFALLGSTRVKATCRMLVKLTPEIHLFKRGMKKRVVKTFFTRSP